MVAATEFTLFVSAQECRDRNGDFFAHPDVLEEASAAAFARKMARFHADERMTSVVTHTSKTVDLFSLLGITDPGNIDVEKAWAATRLGPPHRDDIDHQFHWGAEWMRIPVGVDEHGNVVTLNLREPHELGGMGFHMVIVGTTGSGKTEFLTTLVNSACLTHSPESLLVVAFDYKGSALVHRIRRWPHTVAAHNNLRNDAVLLGKRMGEVLFGELERRKRRLDRAGVGDVAEYEYLRIHRREKLAPIPHMLVVIDEFTQMFIEVEEAKAVTDEIARQGRSLGMRLVMGSQRLGHEMQSGILGNMPIHVALRTEGDTDSRAMIDTDEANYLPADPPGAGILRVGKGGRRLRFQTAYSAQVYQRPRKVAAAAVRSEAEYVPPSVFTAAPMAQLKRPPAPVVVGDAPESRLVIGEDNRPMKQFQMAEKSVAEQHTVGKKLLWLPPLTSVPVDELVHRMRHRPWFEDYGQDAGLSELRFPVGVDDRPFEAKQTVYAKDLARSNCAIVGVGESGRTTAIATMISGAALMYSPRRVQFHVIALSGPAINEVRDLPHVGTFARGTDSETVKRIVAEMVTLINDREAAFDRLGLTIQGLRERKFAGAAGEVPADPFGDVYMVIDGWSTFVKDYEVLTPWVERVLSRGPQHGVHAIISSDGWISGKFTLEMLSNLTSNVELRLGDNDDFTHNNVAVSKDVPHGTREIYLDDPENQKRRQPGQGDVDDDQDDGQTVSVRIAGRGTTEGKTGYHFQAGLPQISLDGRQLSMRDAAEVMLRAVGPDAAAKAVRMLPAMIPLREVLRRFSERRAAHTVVPYGISEIGLQPAVIDFGATAHFLLTGQSQCGLSTGLATIARSVMRRYTPAQAQLYVVDPAQNLLQVVEGAHLGDYVHGPDRTRAMASELAGLLADRLPRDDLSQAELAARTRRWSGPDIFVFIDREEQVADWTNPNIFEPSGGHPLSPLVPLLRQGREIGLHLVVGRRTGIWAKTAMSPLIGPLVELKGPGIVMNVDPKDGEVMSIKGARMPPGRGMYVDVMQGHLAPVQIAVSTRGDAPPVPAGADGQTGAGRRPTDHSVGDGQGGARDL